MEIVISALSKSFSPTIDIVINSPSKKVQNLLRKHQSKITVDWISKHTVKVTVMLDKFREFDEILTFVEDFRSVTEGNISMAKDRLIYDLPDILKNKRNNLKYYIMKLNILYLLTGDKEIEHALELLKEKGSSLAFSSTRRTMSEKGEVT